MHLQNKLENQLFYYRTLLQHHFALNVIPAEKITAWHCKGEVGDPFIGSAIPWGFIHCVKDFL